MLAAKQVRHLIPFLHPAWRVLSSVTVDGPFLLSSVLNVLDTLYAFACSTVLMQLRKGIHDLKSNLSEVFVSNQRKIVRQQLEQ